MYIFIDSVFKFVIAFLLTNFLTFEWLYSMFIIKYRNINYNAMNYLLIIQRNSK